MIRANSSKKKGIIKAGLNQMEYKCRYPESDIQIFDRDH